MYRCRKCRWRRRNAAILAQLDGVTDEFVADAARTMSGAVVLQAGEIPHARIESPGMWFSMSRSIRCTAVMKIGGTRFGTLALPSLTDARRAVDGLTGLLGKALEVNLPWGARRS